MKKNITVFLLAAWCAVPAFAGPGPAWAWDASKITNNGSVQIQSTNGSSTYNAVQNPTGAVAKTNQSALTQPPTVIIQATSGGYAETKPLIDSTTNVPPSCPAGYTRVFTANGPGCPASRTFNIAGTRWSFISYGTGTSTVVGWAVDQAPTYVTSNSSSLPDTGGSATCSQFVDYGTPNTLGPWAASLCTK